MNFLVARCADDSSECKQPRGPVAGRSVCTVCLSASFLSFRGSCAVLCTPLKLLSRAYLAAGGDARRARGAARPTFDPGDADHFAAAASPVLRGLPAGQRD